MDIRSYLRSKGFVWKEVQRPKGLTAIMNCKFCDDKEKKFAISLVDGAFSCLHLNKCGKKGSWWDFQRLFGDKPVRLDGDNFYRKPPLKQYKKPEIKPDAIKDDGYKWLINRGFNKSTIEKFRIGQKNGALMFPTFKDGEHVGTKFRAINEKKFWNEKNMAPYLFNRDNCTFKKEGQGLAICEGHLDCIALQQYNIPSVSVPNGVSDLEWIELEWDYLDQFQKIYLFFDNDDAGQAAVKQIVNRLGMWRCYNVILPYKDANECLLKGVSQEEIIKCIENAVEFNPEMLKQAKDYEDEIVDLFENPSTANGIQTAWKQLNKIMWGLRPGELSIWSGSDFTGKTSMLNEIIADLSRKGYKSVVASLEMMPKRYLKWMLMSTAEKEKLSRKEVNIYLNEHLKNVYVLDFVGDIDPDEVFDVFDFAARKYGVSNFVIDSLMKITLEGQSELRAQKDFVNRFIDEILKKYNAHGHLVAHSKKTQTDDDEPDRVDVSGSKNITDLADNVLIAWRPSDKLKAKTMKDGESTPDGILLVKKCRETGRTGKVKFYFEEVIKKFREIE